jgi:hypothetical protein
MIPKSYSKLKIKRLLAGLCVQCGRNRVKKYRWCLFCRTYYNWNGR